MLLTVTMEDDNLYSVEVDDNATVATLKRVVEFHSGVPPNQQQLLHHNKQLQDSAQLTASGVSSNDLILLRKAPQSAAQGVPSGLEPLLQSLRNNPQLVAQLPPDLRAGVTQGDPQALRQIIRMVEAQRQAQFDALNENEFDPDAQARIAEQIRQQNIEANVDAAMEHSPEVFGEVVMLYVKLHVNNVPLKAFIDSGAQRCVMSLACAERCNIAHLIDKRFRSISRGVGGTQMDVGRVHSVSVMVDGNHIPMAVTVLEKLDIDFLFGLDMLRRHRCSIDLASNCLRFGTLDSTSLEFLPEHELPTSANNAVDAAITEGEAAALASGSAVPPKQAAGAAATARAAATLPQPGPAATPGSQLSSAARTQAQAPGGGQEGDLDAKLSQLMGLGFSKEQCQQALSAAAGNVDHAAAILFGN